MKCPYCGSPAHVFGRFMNTKLHRCDACGAQETGAYADDLTDVEAKTGWYDPRPRTEGLVYMQTRGAA